MPKGYGRPYNKAKRNLLGTISGIEKSGDPEGKRMRATQGKYSQEDFERRLTHSNEAIGKDYGELDRQMSAGRDMGDVIDESRAKMKAAKKFKKGGMVDSRSKYAK